MFEAYARRTHASEAATFARIDLANTLATRDFLAGD
jgi:hypothetical protein